VTRTFAAVVRRDLLLAARQRADVANTLLFFLVVVTMVPLGVGPEINTLRTIARAWSGWRRCWRRSCR